MKAVYRGHDLAARAYVGSALVWSADEGGDPDPGPPPVAPTMQWLFAEGSGASVAGTDGTPALTTTSTGDLWRERGGRVGIRDNRGWRGTIGPSSARHTMIVRLWIDDHNGRGRVLDSPHRIEHSPAWWINENSGELRAYGGPQIYSGAQVPAGRWVWVSMGTAGAQTQQYPGLMTIDGEPTPGANTIYRPVGEDAPIYLGWTDNDTAPNSAVTFSHAAWFDWDLSLSEVQEYTAHYG